MKFKRKLYLTLTGLLLVLVLFTGIESFLEVKYNYIIPSYIPTIGLPIIFVAIILGVFKDTYDELVLFGIKLRRLLCQESGHKSTNKFDFQFKLLNLIF
ncbi:hypothetical protein, partial [Latilactobacillus curvatus]